jgi:Ca-activated chloride channel homolog
MKYIILLFIILLFTEANLLSNDKRSLLREGNKLFKEEKFNDAEIKYRKAQEIEYGYKSTFNLGDALYKQGNYEEATQKFKELSSQNLDKKTLASVNHNLGNSHFMAENFEESVNAYKNALKLNPKDNDTRYNLELARRMLKIQEENKQEEQKDQNKDKNQQDKQDENQQNQDNQQKKNGDKNQDNKQEQDKQDKNQDGKGEEKPSDKQQGDPLEQRPHQISKEDAERMLNAIQKDERDLQKKLRKQKGERGKIERNW